MNVTQTLYQSYYNHDRLQGLQRQVEQLRQRNQQLQQQAQIRQSERFIEAEARNKLNLARVNEVVVMFPETVGVLGATNQARVGAQADRAVLPGSLASWQKLFW